MVGEPLTHSLPLEQMIQTEVGEGKGECPSLISLTSRGEEQNGLPCVTKRC